MGSGLASAGRDRAARELARAHTVGGDERVCGAWVCGARVCGADLELVVELLEGLRVEAHLQEVLQVVARRLHAHVEHVPRVVGVGDAEQHDGAHPEGHLG